MLGPHREQEPLEKPPFALSALNITGSTAIEERGVGLSLQFEGTIHYFKDVMTARASSNGRITCAAWRWREMNGGVQPAFSFSFSWRPPGHGTLSPTFKVDFPPQPT